MANLPRVALILTGGTMNSVGNDRLDLAWYIEAGKRLGKGSSSRGFRKFSRLRTSKK